MVMFENSPSSRAAMGGIAGAVCVTLIHEAARRVVPDPPRMDLLGRRAIKRGLDGAGIERPSEETLQGLALSGDLVANSLYYALAGLGPARHAVARGAALGALAGAGAVALPPVLGLGRHARGLTPAKKAMTFAYYLAGGIVAGLVVRSTAAVD